jgi:hypothetical protein
MQIKKPIAKLGAKETRLGVEAKKKKVKICKKSSSARKVLQLMDADEDANYKKALTKVLKADKRISKVKLEKELARYI